MKRIQTSLFAALVAVSSMTLHAASITWDAGPSGTGTDWATGANWAGDVAPADNITTDSAVFNASTTGQPNIGVSRSVTGINFTGTGTLAWTLSGGAGVTLTLGSGGIDSTGFRDGTVTVNVPEIVMGSASATVSSIFDSTGSLSTSSTFNLGANVTANSSSLLDFLSNRASSGTGTGTVNLNGVIKGTATAGVRFRSTTTSRNTINLNGSNTYDGPTTISQVTLGFKSLANAGSASSFGNSGTITLVDNTSSASMNYTGTGAGATDRLLIITGTGGATINNNGGGAISFNNTGNLAAGTAGARTLTLAGTYTASANTFAETINDLGTSPNITALKVSGGNWDITGNNTHSGGTTINAATLAINSASSLGTGSLTFGGTGTLQAMNAVTLASALTITLSGTDSFDNTAAAGNIFDIGAKLTGAGACKRASQSAFTKGAVRFSNNASDYTGNFSQGFGLTEFTSVANGGSPSSFGAASTAYGIGNSSSSAILRYVGSTSTSTTRAIDWQGTTGGLALENNGAGTVSFLATASLRSGSGASTLTLGGANTGANTLAQVIADSGGVTSLAKSDAGMWVLTGANSYSGTTTISGGTLRVDGAKSGTGTILVASGATLGGSGTITGVVTNQGTIAPGSSIGTLTLNSAPELSGTILAEINRNGGSPVADKVNFAGGVTFGGTLMVTNIGAALANGDTFDLFDGTLSGSFSTLNLPGGIAHWKTSDLNAGGTVTFTNASPTAQNFELTVGRGENASLTFAGSKYALSDADGDAVTVTAVGGSPSLGTAGFTAGSVSYTSTGGSGTDSFTYTATDVLGATTTRTVTVHVLPPGNGANTTGFSYVYPTATLNALGIRGTNYVMQLSTNLTGPANWSDVSGPLATATAATNGTMTLIDVNATNGAAYYRTRVGP